MNASDLYHDFRKPLLNFIRAKLSDKSKAEDVLHDVFLRVQIHLSTVKDASKIESWIYQIARNVIANEFRSASPTTSLETHTSFPEPEPETVSALERLSNSTRRFVAQLPEPYQTALILSDFEHLPQNEIASRFGISLSAAKSRVQRARKMLKELYLKCCSFEQNARGDVLDYEPHSQDSNCQSC